MVVWRGGLVMVWHGGLSSFGGDRVDSRHCCWPSGFWGDFSQRRKILGNRLPRQKWMFSILFCFGFSSCTACGGGGDLQKSNYKLTHCKYTLQEGLLYKIGPSLSLRNTIK